MDDIKYHCSGFPNGKCCRYHLEAYPPFGMYCIDLSVACIMPSSINEIYTVLVAFVRCIAHTGQVCLQENSNLKNAQPVNGYGWDSDVVAVLEQNINLAKGPRALTIVGFAERATYTLVSILNDRMVLLKSIRMREWYAAYFHP